MTEGNTECVFRSVNDSVSKPFQIVLSVLDNMVVCVSYKAQTGLLTIWFRSVVTNKLELAYGWSLVRIPLKPMWRS